MQPRLGMGCADQTHRARQHVLARIALRLNRSAMVQVRGVNDSGPHNYRWRYVMSAMVEGEIAVAPTGPSGPGQALQTTLAAIRAVVGEQGMLVGNDVRARN